MYNIIVIERDPLTTRFAALMSEESIRQSFHMSLTTPYNDNFTQTNKFISEEGEHSSPDWLFLDMYLKEIQKVYSPMIWYHLLGIINGEDPEVVEYLKERFGHSSLRQVAGHIYQANEPFFNASSISFALACAFGADFKKASSKFLRQRTCFEVASNLGDVHNTKASNPEELIERLIQTFGKEDGPHSDYALYLMAQQKGFTLTHISSFDGTTLFTSRCPVKGLERFVFNLLTKLIGLKSGNTTCPAIGAARTIYREYADLLRDPRFSDEFIKSITVKSTSQPHLLRG
jgi:hypothetical protein